MPIALGEDTIHAHVIWKLTSETGKYWHVHETPKFETAESLQL